VTTTEKQDAMLKVLEKDANVDLLYDLWTIVKSCPSKAAEILVQFRDVSAAAKDMVDQLTKTIERFDTIKPRLQGLREASDLMRKSNGDMALIDDKVLNRFHRICEAAEQVKRLKDTGALDMLRSLK
jgi:hypothetical protein